MNENDEDENEVPVLGNLMVEFFFQKENKTVREYLTLTETEGIFGNSEVSADLRVYEVKSDSVEELVTEGTIPLQAWLGRLVAVFRQTTIENKETGGSLDINKLENVKKMPEIDYIFKRE
jgi:hypothetical protein